MKQRLRLSAVVAAALVTVTTLVLGAAGVVGYLDDRRAQTQSLANLSKMQADALAAALALPAWNIDRDQIEKVIDAMSVPKSIVGVTVTVAGHTQGRIRNARDERVPWDGRNPPRNMIIEERHIMFGDHDTGVARLYVTRKLLDEDLRDSLSKLIGTVLAVDVMLILSTYFVLWLAVLRPLVRMERFAAAVSAGQEPLESEHGAFAELETVRRSIVGMVQELDRRYAQLQEEAVRRFESEERFHTIFDSVNDAIQIHDPATTEVLQVNARFTEITGYSSDEAHGLFGRLSSGAGEFTFANAQRKIRALREGELPLTEWEVRHKDGHVIPVEVSLRIARIAGERRVIAVVRDITQRKSMEEALRTSERMSIMGALVAGVAHEVRNPLFGIAATLDAFEAEFGATEASAEYMTVLRSDLSRLTRLMDDLLLYGRPSRNDTYRQPIEPVIAEALRVCAPRATARRIEIRPEFGEALPAVDIDAERMLQVMKNVVENAVEFSEPGAAVAIRVRGEGSGSRSLVCSVVDHGPGFRADDLPHVFEPFFTRRRGGTGLGLAIAQRIVTEHGGAIAASNAEEGGGVIEIRLPLR
jgi:PAS domain S-box-containing protein